MLIRRIQELHLGRAKSSAEGASVEAPQAPRGWGVNPMGEGFKKIYISMLK